MLTVFKEKIGEVRSPEKFFDYNMSSFDFEQEENKLVVSVMESAVVEGDVLVTPLGKGNISDLRTATKLALCLVNYPGFLFDAKGLSVQELSKILLLPDGSLYLELKEPFQYLFQVKARTTSGIRLDSSTDVNIWYFTGRNKW